MLLCWVSQIISSCCHVEFRHVVMLNVVMLNVVAPNLMYKGPSIPLTLKHAHLAVVTTPQILTCCHSAEWLLTDCRSAKIWWKMLRYFVFLVKYIKSSCWPSSSTSNHYEFQFRYFDNRYRYRQCLASSRRQTHSKWRPSSQTLKNSTKILKQKKNLNLLTQSLYFIS